MKARSAKEHKLLRSKHEVAVDAETRHRNMKQVIKFRRREIGHQSPDDFKVIDQSTVQDAEQRYQSLVFQKEERELQQQEELRQKE